MITLSVVFAIFRILGMKRHLLTFMALVLSLGLLTYPASPVYAQGDIDIDIDIDDELLEELDDEEQMFDNFPTLSNEYFSPTFENLGKTLIAMDYYDLKDDTILDEYAQVNYCELYQTYFTNDFEWQRIREAVRADIKENLRAYPRYYDVVGPMYIDRYDFEREAFKLKPDSRILNVGRLTIYEEMSNIYHCGRTAPSNYFPVKYVAWLNQPVNITQIKMSPDDAKALLDRLDRRLEDRMVYVRFRLLVLAVRDVSGLARGATANMHAVLEDISFFEDKQLNYFIAPGPKLY